MRRAYVLVLFGVTACLFATNAGVATVGGCACSAQETHSCQVGCRDANGQVVGGGEINVQVGNGQGIDAATNECTANLNNADVQAVCPAGSTPSTIAGADSVAVSYPDFFETLDRLVAEGGLEAS